MQFQLFRFRMRHAQTRSHAVQWHFKLAWSAMNIKHNSTVRIRKSTVKRLFGVFGDFQCILLFHSCFSFSKSSAPLTFQYLLGGGLGLFSEHLDHWLESKPEKKEEKKKKERYEIEWKMRKILLTPSASVLFHYSNDTNFDTTINPFLSHLSTCLIHSSLAHSLTLIPSLTNTHSLTMWGYRRQLWAFVWTLCRIDSSWSVPSLWHSRQSRSPGIHSEQGEWERGSVWGRKREEERERVREREGVCVSERQVRREKREGGKKG